MHPVTLLIALSVLCVSWIHGGTRVDYMGMLPWLAFATLMATLVVPQRKRGEFHADARARVLRAILRDPVVWAFGILLLLLWAQNLNSPRLNQPIVRGQPIRFDPPPLGLPVWSIHSWLSLEVLQWFLMAFSVVVGARHGLLKASRRKLLLFLCWNGAALAAFGVAQQKILSRFPSLGGAMYGLTPLDAHFFATFGYQNHAGQFFTFLFILSLALFLQRVETEEGPPWKTGLLMIPVALNFAGAILAVSRASIILATAALALFGAYAFIRLWPMLGWGARVNILVIAAVAVGVTTVWYIHAPENIVAGELKGTDSENISQRFFGNYQVPMALQMWDDHRVFGVGAWGYRLLYSQYLPMEEWNKAGIGQANVHHDFVQFLAEHGAIGAGAIAFILLSLLASCARHLFQYQTPEYNWNFFFFRFPFVASLTLAAALCMIADSLVDIPFRSPPCLAIFCLGLICAPAYSPASWRRKPLATKTEKTSSPYNKQESKK